MASKKIVAIVAVVVIVFVALMLIPTNKDVEARYDYEMEITDSFQTSYGYKEMSGAGENFIILTIRIANDSYDDGITTNPYINVWTVVIDGIFYEYSNDTYSYPGYELRKIGVGATLTYHLVFEVPDWATADDIAVEHSWDIGSGPVFELDETLL